MHLPPDPAAHGFDSIAEALNLPPFLMEKYFDAAEKLTAREDVRQAFGKRVRPKQQRGGDPAEIDRAIIAETLRARLPPAAAAGRAGALCGLLRSGDQERGEDRSGALAVAMRAILVAPQFLFRLETGVASEEKGGVRPLTDHELAARLSYFLWNTIPDAELQRAADEGKLRDPEELAAQARRMLRHPARRNSSRNSPSNGCASRTSAATRPIPRCCGAFNGR